MNTNNSTNIKKFEIVPGHAYWDHEKWFDEKNQGRKIP
jgi:hypothetical protein